MSQPVQAAPEREVSPEFIADLAAINPGLVTNEERAVRRAENICADLEAGKDEGAVVSNTAQRFTGGDVTIDEDEARQIIESAERHLCGA